MKKLILVSLVAGLGTLAMAQGFVNLGFETTVISNGNTAALIGWTTDRNYNFINGNPNLIAYNTFALDGQAVCVEGTNGAAGYKAIIGNYSVFIQGGTQFDPDHSGASILQTGQIPISALSIIYWGGKLNASFNGNSLSFNKVQLGTGYDIWQADISPYAGQTGQLMFTAPWQTFGNLGSLLDNIQFSTSPIPEPHTFVMLSIGSAMFAIARIRTRATLQQ